MTTTPEDETTTEGDDETVILARLADAVQAGALAELLESEGISVATPGLTHRSLLGMAGGYVEIVVRVPHKDLARATELYEGLRAVSPPEAGELPEDIQRTDRLRRIAVFAAVCLTFGSGHFYARRWRAGASIAAVELGALALVFFWSPLFWYAIPGLVLADVLGSVLSIGADQRGERPSGTATAAPLLAVLAVALVPLARTAAPSVLAGPAMVAACTEAVRCEGGESMEQCIARAADRSFAGAGSREHERVCAECLAESRCDDVRSDCAECEGLVTLPTAARPADRARGPLGTSPEDMQRVVPQLFRHEEGEGVPEHDLDDLIRSMGEPPPSR